MYKVRYSKLAIKHIQKLKRSGNLAYMKLQVIVPELEQHPREGAGRPERLRYTGDSEEWSRRLDQKNRITYTINDDTVVVEVLSALGHYQDK